MAPVGGSKAKDGANARTPVLFGPAFELLTHPQGVRLDGHLLRGGAATRTVDHCTSPPFVPRNRTRTRVRAQAWRGPSERVSGGGAPGPSGGGSAEQLQRADECRVGVRVE